MLNLASLDRDGGETINFEKGALKDSNIFSIVGVTGSGKSTILDAICLSLYNRAPRYPRKKNDRKQHITIYGETEENTKNTLAPTDCRNIITRGKKKGYSKLTFLANNGYLYRAEWSTSKGTKNFTEPITSLFKLSVKDGQQCEEEVDWNIIPQIIGLDYEQFLRTVLIAQGSFSSFIKAKEDERYALLEKIVGCENLYKDISTKIKKKKDEAVQAYNVVAAQISEKEEAILSTEKLDALKLRIQELEDIRKKMEEDLAKVKSEIAWYDTDAALLEKIAKNEEVLKEVEKSIEQTMEEAYRLKLHEETYPAIALYGEMKTAEANIESLEEKLKDLDLKIKEKNADLLILEENLLKLQDETQKATRNFDENKPHILKAREIKTKLEELKKFLQEKVAAKYSTQSAKASAEKALDDNKKDIQKAQANEKKLQQDLQELKKSIHEEKEKLKERVDKKVTAYNEKSNEFKKLDLVKLQEEKSKVDRTLAILQEGLNIQAGLTAKKTDKEKNISTQNVLSDENEIITKKLKGFDIQKLSDELSALNRVYTLMNSEKWHQHRASLKDEEPCPLCGATHHPYATQKILAPVLDDMKKLIDEKETELDNLNKEKETLTAKQAKNNGTLETLKSNLEIIKSELIKLEKSWLSIHAEFPDWPEDEQELKKIEPDFKHNAEVASQNLKSYNNLSLLVDKLRKEKEDVEKEYNVFDSSAADKLKKAEENITALQKSLAAETGKTPTLQNQLEEKTKGLEEAELALQETVKIIETKESELRQEIGDKDPDTFEKGLLEAKTKAENAEKGKKENINTLKQELEKLSGALEANKAQKENEQAIAATKKNEFSQWVENYNQGKPNKVSEQTIILLSSATDDWPKIKARQEEINKNHTSVMATLKEAKEDHKVHQGNKPKNSKEELLVHQAELDNKEIIKELIAANTGIQNHEKAKKELGEKLEEKQKAEAYKNEWEEIQKAIGSDGDTMRKIAQCYTLRFLIEHANFEIRKFNSRYELQQVKNSLGIRVIDHDRADDVRDTTSLSGGETFIVSLGMALGLSALSSRNISFDNLFIDEGFGTLDPDTLDTVIDSLSMLQTSQGKKVGVISHTDSMSERIATQIRVIKNGNTGSSHIEIYPN